MTRTLGFDNERDAGQCACASRSGPENDEEGARHEGWTGTEARAQIGS